jgi:hypothetical protein
MEGQQHLPDAACLQPFGRLRQQRSDQTVRLWDPRRSGKPLVTFGAH